MYRIIVLFWIALVYVFMLMNLIACSEQLPDSWYRPGGETTLDMHLNPSLQQPAPNLTDQQQLTFYTGHSFAKNPWIVSPASTSARDGLGPLFNARSCMSCHINAGRGRLPATDSAQQTVSTPGLLVRLSIAGDGTTGFTRQGVIPEPVYGDQLQLKAVHGVQAEAVLSINWEYSQGRYADGETYQLRKPQMNITDLAYAGMHPDTQTSLRLASPLTGMGLLEAIPEQAIADNADPDDQNNDGISGTMNYVWSVEQQAFVLGRFGWKASQPTVKQQTAAALRNDMGIVSHLFTDEVCTGSQTACLYAPNGNNAQGVEVDDKLLSAMTLFTESLAVPARNSAGVVIEQGKALFHQAQCAACHTPSFTTTKTTANPAFANQIIWPYSDLLLHDMGDELADHRPDFKATGREWRTPPLWGLSVVERINSEAIYLHDGRARTLSEAILWHGGEAEYAKQQFVRFNKQQRERLITFLQSL